jgi:Uma2 family endonuclease
MLMRPRTRATVEDLHRVQETGKAELVNGEIVLMTPAGGIPG